MCSKIAAKLINSSDESSIGSAVYFSRRVFTENLKQKHRNQEELENHNSVKKKDVSRVKDFQLVSCRTSHAAVYCTVPKQTNVLLYGNNGREEAFFLFFGNHAILSY